MAGLIIEMIEAKKADIKVEVIPGVTAATAVAAVLGAPLMEDFAVLSLSDLLIPWESIEKKLTHAAESDIVIVLYNPQSRERTEPLAKAHKILLRYRDPDTCVGIVRKAGREGEEAIITTLGNMLSHEIDMVTTIIVGNSKTRVINGKMVTPRGYNRKYIY